MSRRNPWIDVCYGAWSLGVESAAVMALRTWKIGAGGSPATAEISRMVSEKINTGLALQALALTGGLGLSPPAAAAKAIAHYRRKVRANRRRMAKR